MGCRESKHIATDNTIITRTSSKKSTNRGQDDNDKNNVETLQRSRSGRSPVQKQESLKENNVGDSKANNVLNENEKSGDDKITKNGKESGKLKETNDHHVAEGDKELIKGKKEPVEETKDTKTGEETAAKENLTRIVNANPDNHMQEAEVDEKIKEAEAAVASTENHLRETEVEEKIKDAEAAVESLEKLVNIKNMVKETEEISAKKVESTNSSSRNPEKQGYKSEEIPETQVASTDATLQNAVTESDKTKENFIKEAGEAVENGVKEIHEVAGKPEEIPVKEVETFHDAKQENQALVADKAEEVLQIEAEADKVEESLVTAADAANTAVKTLESVAKDQSQDAANTEEDTKSSSNANGRLIPKQDPDVQINTEKQ